MLAIYVDFNDREILDAEGNQAVHLRFDVVNPPGNEVKMRAGLRVLVYDEGDTPDLFCLEVEPSPEGAYIQKGSSGHSLLLSDILTVQPPPD